MERYCILVADGARARFFAYKERPWEWGTARPKLAEQADLVNPERVIASADMYREARSAAHPAGTTGHHAAFDDHRDKSRREAQRRFARRMAERLAELAGMTSAARLVVCAGPELMGLLRPELDRVLHPALRVQEVTRDWTHLATDAVHAHLIKEGVLLDPGPPPELASA